MQKILFVGIIIALILEGTLTSLPLVLMMLLITATKIKSSDGFFLAFSAGFILDVLLLRPLGETSVYFLIVLLLLVLYERKYEVASVLFVTIATFIVSSIYYLIFPVPQSILQVIMITLLSFVTFSLIEQISKRRVKQVRL